MVASMNEASRSGRWSASSHRRSGMPDVNRLRIAGVVAASIAVSASAMAPSTIAWSAAGRMQ